MLVVKTPNFGDVPLGDYVQGWKDVLAEPSSTVYSCGLATFDAATRDEVLKEFRDGLADRINRNIPGYGQGRKWGSDWQRWVGQFARKVNTPRLIVRVTEAPPVYRERLAHRFFTEED